MSKFILSAKKRDLMGSKTKKLRKTGHIPAVVYGKSVDSLPITLESVQFNKIYKNAGETNLVYLKIEGEDKERPTLIKLVNLSPVKSDVVSVDFHQVSLKEKVSAQVPLEVVGQSEAIKTGLAILSQNIHEVEVECLPTDIPESFEVNIESLKEIGDHLKVSDLKVPSGVEINADMETVIVSLTEPQKEEEPLDTTITEVAVVDEENKESETTSEEKPQE